MAAVNLKKMSDKELTKLEGELAKEIAVRAKGKLVEAKKAAEAAAKKHGFSLNDLVSGAKRSGTKKKAAAPAKFRNPANPDETWSGRGRQPVWYKEAVSKGKDPKEMAI